MEKIIISIGIPVATFILGYIAGVYIPLKFRKEDRTPNISISPFQERQNYFGITNHGGDLLNFNIEISWLQDATKQTRILDDFFNSTEDLALAHSHKCNSLKKGETKNVAHCPLYSDNGTIQVVISGEDANGSKYSRELTLKNHIKN